LLLLYSNVFLRRDAVILLGNDFAIYLFDIFFFSGFDEGRKHRMDGLMASSCDGLWELMLLYPVFGGLVRARELADRIGR
jgi:hypothetical protein